MLFVIYDRRREKFKACAFRELNLGLSFPTDDPPALGKTGKRRGSGLRSTFSELTSCRGFRTL